MKTSCALLNHSEVFNRSWHFTRRFRLWLWACLAVLSGWAVVPVGQAQTVMGWGYNDYGQTTIPAGLSGVIALAAGPLNSFALKSDGTVIGWGNNYYGQMR